MRGMPGMPGITLDTRDFPCQYPDKENRNAGMPRMLECQNAGMPECWNARNAWNAR